MRSKQMFTKWNLIYKIKLDPKRKEIDLKCIKKILKIKHRADNRSH